MNTPRKLAPNAHWRTHFLVLILVVIYPYFGYGQTPQEVADQKFREITKNEFAGKITEELTTLLKTYEQLPFSENYVEVMSRLAYELNDSARPMSDSLALRAIELASTSLGDSLAVSTYYAYRALARSHWENYPKAQFYLDQSLQTFDEYNQTYFYVYKEKLLRAMDVYDVPGIQNINDELEALFSGPDSAQVAPYRIMLYDAKMTLARFQENGEQQIAYAQKVLQLDQENPFYIPEDRIGVVADLAMSYVAIGQVAEAEQVLQRAIAEVEDRLDVLGTAYLALSIVYAKQGRLAESVEVGKLAVEAGEKTGNVDMGSATFNLATDQYLLRQLSDAHETLQKAKNYIPPTVQFVAYDLESRILTAKGSYLDAIRAAQAGLINLSVTFTDTAVTVNPTSFDEFQDVTWAAQLLHHKAVAQAKQGEQQQDIETLRMAQATNDLSLAFATDGYSDLQGFELTQYHGFPNIMIQRCLKLETSLALEFYHLTSEPAYLDAAFLSYEKQKSAGLLQTMAPPQLPAEELKRLDDAKRTLVDAQRAAALSTTPDNDRAEVIRAGENLAELVQSLREKYPLQSNYHYAIPYVDGTALQAHLPVGTALISYDVFQEEPCAFVITDHSKQVVPLPAAAESEALANKVLEYTQLLRSPLLKQRAKQQQFNTLGLALYNQLLTPLQAHLEGIDHLIIIGEGALRNLPFEALLTESIGESEMSNWPFLIRDYQLSYQYSATAYVLTQQKAAITNQSLLAFAPVFTDDQQPSTALRSSEFATDSLFRSIRDGQFSPLPASREEVLAIARSLPTNSKQTVLLESDATKAALLAQLNGTSYQYVHIATHGLANLREARRSALACYSKGEPSESLLYLDEIQLQAVNADLVVLSSCDSGIGQFADGEGMLALSRAFLYAGARNVVSSLWKVSDRQTKNFMLYFYEALRNGKSYSAALQAAKLNMLSDPATSLPRYWSAFMLMGR